MAISCLYERHAVKLAVRSQQMHFYWISLYLSMKGRTYKLNDSNLNLPYEGKNAENIGRSQGLPTER